MKALRSMAALVLLPGLLSLGGCQKGPELQGKVDALKQLTSEAKKNGAVHCAARQLALAEAYLEFAEFELSRGRVRSAQKWVDLASVNASSAELESPPEQCQNPLDRDGDGISDGRDRCPVDPETYNGLEDGDGCPDDADTDGDGISDSNDACVVDAEDLDLFEDYDGCPEIDNDLDEVIDTKDLCPKEAEDPDGYEDQDGCPELDNDHDQVPDATDACPSTPGQNEVEPLGCTVKPALVVLTDCEVKIKEQIHFAYGKDVIKPESYPILDAVRDVLEKNPAIKIEVQGHTDDKGSTYYNLDLSNRRAQSVRKYLVAHGLSPDRLTAHGYGEDLPLVPNDSEDNRSLNRRVQFVRTESQKGECAGAAQTPSKSVTP
jgi:OmpA-OmpF porin, OOP family